VNTSFLTATRFGAVYKSRPRFNPLAKPFDYEGNEYWATFRDKSKLKQAEVEINRGRGLLWQTYYTFVRSALESMEASYEQTLAELADNAK
jgi:hypothetical protein